MYFVIRNNDGNTYVIMYTKEELERQLNSWLGEQIVFLENINNVDPTYWRDAILVVKGEIIIPTAKVVTKWSVA